MSGDNIKDTFRPGLENLGFEMFTLTDFFEYISVQERVKPHRIKFYALIFVTDGAGVHQVDFENYDCSKGNLIFIRKDMVHSWLVSEDLKGYVMIFTEEFISYGSVKFGDLSFSYPYNSVLYKPTINISDCEDCQSFLSLTDYLYLEFISPNSRQKKEILQSLLRALFLKIQSAPTKEFDSRDKEAVETFVAFQRLLEQKLSETRNAADYCKYLNISFRKLNAICKVLTNKTLKAFIDELIMLKAKRYLFNGELNISEMSHLLGFDEVTNFTKFFKKHEGISPKAFGKNTISKG